MSRRQTLSALGAFIGMLILIFDSQTAIWGAQEGVNLCLTTIIPSLFPFFMLSVLLTGNLLGGRIPFLKHLQTALGIPNGTESILLIGLLGGYPVGAQVIGQAFHQHQISKEEAEHMLAFSNNAGPAFIFGMVSSMFPGKKFAVLLWVIHIISALLVGVLTSKHCSRSQICIPNHSLSIATALANSIKITASVCGWVILFRVVLAFLDKWILCLLRDELKVLLAGLLELSNGCCRLCMVSNISIRFFCCSILLAAGGLCITMQTVTVTQGLSLRLYFFGKILQVLISVILCFTLLYHNILPVFFILYIVFIKTRKKSSFHYPVGV